MSISCGIIILAAGNSSRLGSPKQLLPVHDGNLLQHAVQTALEAEQSYTIVVLGASKHLIEPVLPTQQIRIVYNEQWEEGISSSIKAGLTALLAAHPGVDAALFMVCDQPYVTPALLRQIIDTYHKTGKTIVASAYRDTAGTPALFDKALFPQLQQLQGDTGAKKIIATNSDAVATVPFIMGNIDIDTTQDYDKYQSESRKDRKSGG